MITSTRVLLASGLFLPFLLPTDSGATKLAFSVSEGATKTRTITNTVDLTLDDMLTLMNEQEGPSVETEMSMESKLELVVTDRYVELREGAPKKLRRTFDKVAQQSTVDVENPMIDQTTEVPYRSALQGKEVIFTWDAEEEEYAITFPDDEGDQELLEGLHEDLDLRGFLPDGEVEEGEEWEVDPVVLAEVLAPGGDLKLVPEEVEMAGGMNPTDTGMGDFSAWFSEGLEGSVKARFVGTRETAGVKVGEIAIEVDITSAVDMTEKSQERLERAELPAQVEEIEITSSDLQLELESEGTLLWNLDAGCALSFELKGEFELSADTTMEISAQGVVLQLETVMDFSGTLSSSSRIE